MPPSLVQVASNAAAATSVTVTLGSPTTAGNTLVVLYGDSADTTNASVTGITLGGSADNWAQEAVEGTSGDHAIVSGWADPSCAGGQTSVVIGTNGTGGNHLFAYVLEWQGLTGTLDVSSGGANSFSGTWTSGATAATSQASEVAFGVTCGAVNGASGTAAGLAGPAGPWVNEPQQSLNGASHTKAAIAGYQILSATGAQAYSGTASPTNTNDTLVFTLEAASGGGGATISGVTATSALAAPAGAVSAGATIAGVVGASALAAPTGSVHAGETVAGPTATETLAAPAGSVSAGARVSGPVAAEVLAAPAGTVGPAVVAQQGTASIANALSATATAVSALSATATIANTI